LDNRGDVIIGMVGGRRVFNSARNGATSLSFATGFSRALPKRETQLIVGSRNNDPSAVGGSPLIWVRATMASWPAPREFSP
jgi:hypothetical protein